MGLFMGVIGFLGFPGSSIHVRFYTRISTGVCNGSGVLQHVLDIPRGSYPIPFLGYLVLWLGSPIWKSRYLKKGVGYEPIL